MNKIYRKLAFQNIKNNKQIYIPYILTSSVTIFMYYIFLAIQNSPDIVNSRGGEFIKSTLGLGEFVITLFSAIFLIYTNKFLIRNRDRELGLINMLGVDKKGISKIMIYENIFLTFINIFIGVVASIIFSTVIFLLIGRYLSIEISDKFYVDFKSIVQTIIVYAFIFLVVLIGNIMRIKKLKPLDLLKEAEKGEKEPKANIFITIIGIICIVVGYYLANSTENILQAMNMFLIAVILVIIGTYILFGTISIAILKVLKKNKKIYYKSKNMTFISSLIFRMKQNAVSLANICILSTMVLVMLVSTTALISGKDNYIETIFPTDISIEYNDEDIAREKEIKEIIYDSLKDEKFEISEYSAISSIKFSAGGEGNKLYVIDDFNKQVDFSLKFITIYDIEDYNKISNKDVKLKDNEAILHSNKNIEMDNLVIGDTSLKIKKNIENIENNFKDMEMDLYPVYSLIVNDKDAIYKSLFKGQEIKKNDGIIGTNTIISFNLDGNKDKINKWADDLEINLKDKYKDYPLRLTNKDIHSKEFVALHGGIFIVTILLSILFLVATIMIIYYKQVSEGIEDAKSTSILSKIGMSEKEIRKNISKQTRVVFFMPLIVSIIHLIGASSIVYNIISIVGVGNKEIFMRAGVITIFIYSLIYTLIYKITLNAYYKMTQNFGNKLT